MCQVSGTKINARRRPGTEASSYLCSVAKKMLEGKRCVYFELQIFSVISTMQVATSYSVKTRWYIRIVSKHNHHKFYCYYP